MPVVGTPQSCSGVVCKHSEIRTRATARTDTKLKNQRKE
jgi:hypothetical protein